jgi:hypothetical protein
MMDYYPARSGEGKTVQSAERGQMNQRLIIIRERGAATEKRQELGAGMQNVLGARSPTVSWSAGRGRKK